MIKDALKNYRINIDVQLKKVDLTDVFSVIFHFAKHNCPTFVFGNGGSASVAEHLSCDWTKGVKHASLITYPRVHSLVSNQSLITAIANDYGYDKIFSEQIDHQPYNKALAIAISSSGNSENIIHGLRAAKRRQYETIALVGFDGGRILREKLAEHIVHIPAHNYGVVEDCHSIIMHVIAQQLATECAGFSHCPS